MGSSWRTRPVVAAVALALAGPTLGAQADTVARICPENYEGIDTRNLVQPPGSRMVLVTMVFLCVTLATLFTYVLLYAKASRDLRASLTDVVRQDSNPGK